VLICWWLNWLILITLFFLKGDTSNLNSGRKLNRSKLKPLVDRRESSELRTNTKSTEGRWIQEISNQWHKTSICSTRDNNLDTKCGHKSINYELSRQRCKRTNVTNKHPIAGIHRTSATRTNKWLFRRLLFGDLRIVIVLFCVVGCGSSEILREENFGFEQKSNEMCLKVNSASEESGRKFDVVYGREILRPVLWTHQN
jgi:hypothetical protein